MDDVENEMIEEMYEKAKQVRCPYANCGAGVGMECLVHHRDAPPSIRESPHVVRVREANGERGDD